jgi:hypothetical protein
MRSCAPGYPTGVWHNVRVRRVVQVAALAWQLPTHLQVLP